MIAIVSYGSGNVNALANIYRRLNIPAVIAAGADDIRRSDRIILPGVGSFDGAMSRFNASGLRPVVEEMVLERKTPALGICVGMQMLARRSEEGAIDGLGWIDGDVRRFDVSGFAQRTHLPHMGWNSVAPRASEGLFAGLDGESRFYFLHSYYFSPGPSADVLSDTDYSGRFASSVGRGNVFGVQFHPEKSHQWGIRLLKNFAEL